MRRRSVAIPAPSLLFLHGGPHSAYVASYISSIAYLAALGYVVLIVSRNCHCYCLLITLHFHCKNWHVDSSIESRCGLLQEECVMRALLYWTF